MGRPPLGYIRTHISFDAETLARMDKIVGEKGRAKFVRLAVDKMLDAVELTQRLEAAAKLRGE